MLLFGARLYTIRKFPLNLILEYNRELVLNKDEERRYYINESDSLLFRQIRLITGNSLRFNPYIIFVDCKSSGGDKEQLLFDMIINGFTCNGTRYVCGERSASMTRMSILSFVDESIADELTQRVLCGAHVDKTVLAKYYAYRGLLMSSCHCLEDWYPKIVIVPDLLRVIPRQQIKCLYDEEVEFVDKEGQQRTWRQKNIKEETRDIEINAFDGCGIHHPAITEHVYNMIGCDCMPTAIMWRAPYLKGLTFEVDYVAFFRDRGVTTIRDIWGTEYGVRSHDPPLIIMSESMYKGFKYYDVTSTATDWDYYWEQFKLNKHCLGVAKWNFSLEQEPVYTRGNYQIFQDLNLSYDDFAPLAKDTIDWLDALINGDYSTVCCFLGLFADRCKPADDYTRAILKNPEMLKEQGVRNNVIRQIEKMKNKAKCGKLWLKGCFKLLAPDLIMLMEHVAGLEPVGCLDAGEFFSQNIEGALLGEHLIERNPHICHSEHVIAKGVDNELRQKYCYNLINVCMVNNKSIITQRLNGADFDGDMVLVLDNQIMQKGVNKNAIPVIDIDDKATVEVEQDTPQNRAKIAIRTKKNLIGEYSNYASAYHNKMAKTPEQKEKYNNYIDIISVLTGKSIDYAKTGVLYPMPRNIAKFGRPLPYFMRYVSDYYKRMKLSKAYSCLNRLCFDIERWEKQFRWKRTYSDFDYKIMVDDTIKIDEDTLVAVEKIYLDFCKEVSEIKKDEAVIKKEWSGAFEVNWDYYYDKFRGLCGKVCPDIKKLANIAVLLCYEKYPKKSKYFMWCIAGAGIVENLKQEKLVLPLLSETGTFEYLGRRYDMVELVEPPQDDATTNQYIEEEEFYFD